MLLGWDILHAQNDTAAILYPIPVRVSSIRVFPTGAQPFSQSPEAVALTKPESFFLDVFFNSYAVQSTSGQAQDPQEKRVVKNALAPTRIAFAGRSTEFIVDMGTEYATRLIIFRGDFEVVSVAIYGEKVEKTSEAQTYEPSLLPVTSPITLSPSVDLANADNSTLLADQLLSLFPAPPSLSLVSRLVFSLKPEQEDWDDPDFPYIYSDLDDDEVSDLEGLVQSITRPIRDDVSPESLASFATKMHDFLGSNPSDDAYFVAKLLTKAASQQTRISRTLLQHLDLPEVFNEHSLDDTTVLCLRDAAANIEIARYFSEDKPFLKSLEDMYSNPKTERPIQKALKKLLARLRGWQTFEDALANVDGDFATSAIFLEDITTGEHSLGCWLECMLNHDNLKSKLGVTSPSTSKPPPLLFHVRHPEVSHDQFVTFVRALLGISSVLATLAWSDSIGNVPCRERALSILVLWQTVDGYRKIVNHCLLLRQLTKRLGWNKSDDIPTKSAVLAERLLVALAKDPQAMLREHLVETVLSLEAPFAFIEAEEMLEIGKLARVARDGLSSAIEELAYTSVRPFSLRRLRVLRVSMAIVQEEMAYDEGDFQVLESFWEERGQGIGPTLIPILVDISDDLNHHFALQPLPRMNQALADLLFRTADDLLHLIAQFVLAYPPPSRDLRNLTRAIADLYACSHATSASFSSCSAAYQAAQQVRQTCLRILGNITEPNAESEAKSLDAEIVLHTLLDHASQSAGRDPVHHLLQIYDLIDKFLPGPPGKSGPIPKEITEAIASFWVPAVFPKVLPELKTFYRLLDSETRARFLAHLNALDDGETGIGEWLLIEELKNLLNILNDLSSSWQANDRRLILLYQIGTSIQFLEGLISSSSTSTWATSSLSTNADLSQLLDDCLSLILAANLSSLHLTRLTRQLGKHASDFGPDVRFHILLLILRNAGIDPSVVDALDFVPGILKSLPATTIAAECIQVQREVGKVISAYSEHAPSLQADNAEMLLCTLEWLASQEDIKLTRLAGISLESFQYLCTMLGASLPGVRQEALKAVEAALNVDEDELFAPSTTELPEAPTLPLSSVESMLFPKPFEPSTPKKGTKTPDILGVVISPPTALLRSPAATGLTKTYTNNDFRQLRQAASTRLNTSRMPSTHVDDFEPPSPERLLAAAQIETMQDFQGFLPGL